MDNSNGEVFVLPFYGQGHLLPSMELCIHLSSRNYSPTLIIPSYLSSSISSSFRNHPLIRIAELEVKKSESPPPDPVNGGGLNRFREQHQQLGRGIEKLLLPTRPDDPGQTRPVIAVVDEMMSWSMEVFGKFGIPIITFFTSGACCAALEYGGWRAGVGEMKPGDIRVLPGLPEHMPLAYSDFERRSHDASSRHVIGGNEMKFGPSGFGKSDGPHEMKGGPRVPGQKPRWVEVVDGSIAVLINTCDDLERPFIDYLATEIGKPVWGVGPLLPEKYWKSAGSLIHDGEIRSSGRKSNYPENEVIQWLDLKPRGSVIYISFGSEIGPSVEEYEQIANALEVSNQPFIWVLQLNSGKTGPAPAPFGIQTGSAGSDEGYYPHGLDKKVGNRGLIIHGWAPQLLILSHPSTGGFLSHCGWNSTVEAVGRGVPILAWPLGRDQFYNAKLLVLHLKVGCMVSSGGDDSAKGKTKDDIVDGIERLMSDVEVHKEAEKLKGKFVFGFPRSSVEALDALANFFINQATI